MALQCFSMPVHPLQSMFATIQQMYHHIRTAYGDSEITIYNTLEIPQQGILQGNGLEPTSWAVTQTPIINIMRDKGYRVYLTTAISKQNLKVIEFVFVNDTDLAQGKLQPLINDIELVAIQIQRFFDHWEEYLKATGGAF